MNEQINSADTARLHRVGADEGAQRDGPQQPSIPLRASVHAITELQFHRSPVASSSRPHTGVGIWWTTRVCRARALRRQSGPTKAVDPSGRRVAVSDPLDGSARILIAVV